MQLKGHRRRPAIVNRAHMGGLGGTFGADAQHRPVSRDAAPLRADEVRAAITERRIGVAYQPKVSLTTDIEWIVDGVEALARIHHPTRGEVLPGDFIDVVEQAGWVAEFTGAVLEVVMRDLALLRGEGYIVDASVNVSPTLLADGDLPGRLEARLRDYHLLPSQLILEITEGAPWPEDAAVMRNLARLRIKGMRLSLDDFGKGYSTLAQLYRMPFNELKNDRSFIVALDRSEDARIITRSMISLARALGLEVCAEGIETYTQLAFLKSAGCDRAQGYLLEKPVDLDRLRALLRSQFHTWPALLAANGTVPAVNAH